MFLLLTHNRPNGFCGFRIANFEQRKLPLQVAQDDPLDGDRCCGNRSTAE